MKLRRIISLLLSIMLVLSVINFEAVFAENASATVVVESETETAEESIEVYDDINASYQVEEMSDGTLYAVGIEKRDIEVYVTDGYAPISGAAVTAGGVTAVSGVDGFAYLNGVSTTDLTCEVRASSDEFGEASYYVTVGDSVQLQSKDDNIEPIKCTISYWTAEPEATGAELDKAEAPSATPTFNEENAEGFLNVFVADTSGNPIENAEVSIRDKNATTDSSGVATLTGIEPGSYYIHIYADGYREKRTALKLMQAEKAANTYVCMQTPEEIGAENMQLYSETENEDSQTFDLSEQNEDSEEMQSFIATTTMSPQYEGLPDNSMYGYNGSVTVLGSSNNYVYNIQSGTWSTATGCGYDADFACVIQNELYYGTFGTYDSTDSDGSLVKKNLETGDTIGLSDVPAQVFSVVAVGDTLYGVSKTGYAYYYNKQTDTWTQKKQF